MRFDVVTIFPHILDSYVNESILKRAREKGLINVKFWDLRDFTDDKHRSVDDAPYGGGPGMVLKVEPIWKCLKKVQSYNSKSKVVSKKRKSRVILMSPRGSQFNQEKAGELAKLDQLVLICGRYEGVDARVEKIVDEQVSIGPYVLSGGELPAMAVAEAVTRLLPGVLGSEDSLCVESFGANIDAGRDCNGIKSHFIEYPQYTRPEVFEPATGIKWAVPEVLLSGNHKKIKEWRRKSV